MIATHTDLQSSTTTLQSVDCLSCGDSPKTVSFAQEIESVRVVENFRLTLNNREKKSYWDLPDEDDFIEQILFEALCQPEEKTQHKKKKRRQRTLIFGDLQKRPTTCETQKKSKTECSPLQCIRRKLSRRRKSPE